MPRYFLTTASERLVVSDDEGIDLPHVGALNEMICTSLAEMFAAEGYKDHQQSFSVYASDENGDEVMTATLNFIIRGRQTA